MHIGAECIGEHQTLQHAARRMRDLDVGALPICGDDDRLHGIITDRDIVTKCIANGADPATVTAGQLAQGTPVTVDSAAGAGEVMDGAMARYGISVPARQLACVPVVSPEDQAYLGAMAAAANYARANRRLLTQQPARSSPTWPEANAARLRHFAQSGQDRGA